MNDEVETDLAEIRAVQSAIDDECEAELMAERYLQPFCACGRVVSECDGSRRACVRRQQAR